MSRMSFRIHDRNAPTCFHAVVECPNCGRIPRPTGEIMVELTIESPDYLHCHFRCERCGSDKAVLHFDRETLSRH